MGRIATKKPGAKKLQKVTNVNLDLTLKADAFAFSTEAGVPFCQLVSDLLRARIYTADGTRVTGEGYHAPARGLLCEEG